MVQTKHQKSKQKKIKKHGKQTDISELRSQLDALGLKIIQVTADGNCFFRALADQLEGNEEEHQKYRTMVVDYIKMNREMFEPFIEDEVPFDEYCDTMDNDGTWAGNMELQAASLVTRSNICIHRSMSPRWYIRNFEKKSAHMIHLSYHDGEHYNSVRSKEDSCDGPARPIIIKADANLTAISHQSKSAESTHSRERGSGDDVPPSSIKMVISGSGCEDTGKVKEVLEQVGGDVDAAIEFLIAEMHAELSLVEDNGSFRGYTNVSKNQNKHDMDQVNANDEEDEVMKIKQKAQGNSKTCKDNKKIPRNRVCPCGSKKKYKNCCGAASGKTAIEIEDSSKGKKGKKQQGKRGAVSDVSSLASNGPLSDLGALCI